MSAAKRISVSNIERAAREIDPVFIHSPQFVNEPLNDVLGCELTLKLETMNPIRSFKGRGADFFFRENREMVTSRQVVCATAGNFGQAVAYAAARNGVKPIVYCATNANPLKVERMKRLGADVRQAGENFDASKEAAKEYCAQHGAYFVEDGRDVAISEGAGSIAVAIGASKRSCARPRDASATTRCAGECVKITDRYWSPTSGPTRAPSCGAATSCSASCTRDSTPRSGPSTSSTSCWPASTRPPC